MATVTFTDVEKRYDGVVVMEKLNLEVHDREFLVLVGPSGSGKSTALRMLAGLEEISGGTIAIGGRIVNDVPPKDRDIAMVFQNYALFPHMTVRENLSFGLRIRKRPPAEVDQLVAEAARVLGLTGLLDRRPRQLSGGERQRVALGRAIVRKPAVFLFDEPLSNLDAKLRIQMRAEIKRLQRDIGTTTVYVTHDQVEAMTMGSRIAVMRQGRLQQVGTPAEVYRRPANLFVAGFIGSPPMNLLPASAAAGRLRASGFSVGSPGPLRALVEGSRVVIGIRPEDLRLGAGEDAAGSARIPIGVELCEPIGHEIIVHGRCGDDPVVCLARSETIPEIGSRLEASVRPDRFHFFDPSNELRLDAGTGGA